MCTCRITPGNDENVRCTESCVFHKAESNVGRCPFNDIFVACFSAEDFAKIVNWGVENCKGRRVWKKCKISVPKSSVQKRFLAKYNKSFVVYLKKTHQRLKLDG